MPITDPASKLRLLAATHDLSRATTAFAETQMKVRWRSPAHEKMMMQVMLHLAETQKYLHHIVKDLQAEGFGDIDRDVSVC
jgi:hypothetical protein